MRAVETPNVRHDLAATPGSRWMGHETEEMKKRYRHLDPVQTDRMM